MTKEIVDLPINRMVIFDSNMLNYQRLCVCVTQAQVAYYS